MSKFMIFIALCWCATHAFTQISLPYHTGFDDNASMNGWTSYRTGSTDAQPWGADNGNAFSPTKSLVHYYPVGGSAVTDDWFVSPAFLIPEGGTLDSLRYAFGGFGMPQESDTVAIYLLTGSSDPELASSRQLLYLFSGNLYQNDNTWRLLDPVSLSATNATCYLAFRYHTIVNWLDVRFDNVSISGNETTAVTENQVAQLQLSPNPSEGTLQLLSNEYTDTETDFQLSFYDNNGRYVCSQVVKPGEAISLQMMPGYYMYSLVPSNNQRTQYGKLLVR